MKPILRRVGKLEVRHALSGKPRSQLRLLISLPWKGPANLATSTCKRSLNAAGGLIEVVDLDGGRDALSDDDLERFIDSFPVQRCAGWNSR